MMTSIDFQDCTVHLIPLPQPQPGDDKRHREREACASLVAKAFGSCSRTAHYEDGAPYVDTNPDIPISISHSDTTCALAIARSRHMCIGIDIERPRMQLRRVAARFLTDDEYPKLCLLDEDRQLDHLLKKWTAKEAVYKAARTPGLGLKEIQVSDDFSRAETPGQAYRISYHRFSDGEMLCIALSEDDRAQLIS
ncbi:4'-phosphopantetheinyl transferase superfamily protein [Duncaniella dubosii]|uniref:4'-phosphopantetheinyl transferase superfamily protein n=1 Tax=Duncaniella dubosii TaxID=2518971 RepID=A0A4P7W0U1_9BACT|nr:4'-phosphopantetheinyl transferase superfamily protein [Duncaniella dubosii]QCD41494.1 4'-phosphopantetheinyl transferase superfamily protein [Duncaniella dubosii]